jgi:transmembrane sensor
MKTNMPAQPHPEIRAQAVDWYLRMRSGGDGDWEEFVEWLEADPARAEAYDQIVEADDELIPEAIPLVPAPRAANDDSALDEGRPGRRWMGALAGLAALFLLGLIAIPWLNRGPDRYEVATAAGEQREVAIGDGSRVTLNGGTRLVLDRNDARFAELVAGEATFQIRHDAAAPFTVNAGDHRIQDAGTVFNLVHEPHRLALEVIEGAVVYDPHRTGLQLAAGQTLTTGADDRAQVARRNPDEMAGWRRGRLNYRGVPLEIVARDLGRSLGVEVALDPAIARTPFTGTLRVEDDPGAAVTDLATLTGHHARRTGDSWLIEPDSRAPR